MSAESRRPVRHRAVVLVAALLVVAALGMAAVAVERQLGSADADDGVRTETVVVEAPRGRILDRSGKVLVEDATVLEVRADRGELDALDAGARAGLLETLAGLLTGPQPPVAGVAASAPVSVDGLEAALDSPDDVVVLATGVEDEVREAIEADPVGFPGITVTAVGRRTYHYGALAAHVLGYSGRITEDELAERSDEDLPGDAIVGKSGIEGARDTDLRGTPGQIVYEVDAGGQRVRELTDRRTEPTPGRDVVLTIDINMQFLVEKGLAAEVERRRGVVDNGCPEPGCDPKGAASVAVDPRNGQVLAMASYPTYDPNLFVGGISEEDYEAISDPNRGAEHGFPLLNRALAGQYAAGSTFKLFSAYAGLANGMITPQYVYDDTGIYLYSADCNVENPENNCSATNAGAVATGAVDLAEALTLSSDTYFYKIGDDSWRARERIGEEAMQEEIEAWGLGSPTGIDLPGEASGRVPTPEWLMDFSINLNGDTELGREAGTWTPGVSGNTMVGQGDVLVTPLQLAQGYATLANGGTIWRPQLVLQTAAPDASSSEVEVPDPESTGEVDLPPEWRDPLVAGFDEVTKTGTAATAFGGFDQSACPVAGKTGTAQVTGRSDSSLFTAFAPTPTEGRESVIAMATVFDEAGFGAAAAVPLTRRVLEPFASTGCDIDAFGAPGSPWEAPLGGWFDVDEAQAEFIPIGTDTEN